MADERLALMAHLLRRAGFGTTREELEAYAARPYEEVVEELVNPERMPDLDEDLLRRYYPHLGANQDNPNSWNGRWVWRMVNSQRPLEEKMALFWHHVLATGWTKSEHTPTMVEHVEMLRRDGLGNFRTILVELSNDPAMIYWLDNNENHARSINENYGREILELFPMGIGNYSETDIKNVARAFTGWTFEQPIPLYPYGHYASKFVYKARTTTTGEKTFLGTPATSTAKISSTSSVGRRPRPASSAATSTTSSSRTRRRCPPGAFRSRAIQPPSTRCRRRSWTLTPTSAPSCACCSTATSSSNRTWLSPIVLHDLVTLLLLNVNTGWPAGRSKSRRSGSPT